VRFQVSGLMFRFRLNQQVNIIRYAVLIAIGIVSASNLSFMLDPETPDGSGQGDVIGNLES